MFCITKLRYIEARPLLQKQKTSLFRIHRWIEDYHQSGDQAIALKEMVEDQAENPDALWDYIEMRYSAGKGSLHSEL